MAEMELLDCRQTSFMCDPSGTCVAETGKEFTAWKGAGFSLYPFINIPPPTPDNLASFQPNTVSLNWLGMQDLKESTLFL